MNKIVGIVFASVFLVACGGGGGGSTPAQSQAVQSFAGIYTGNVFAAGQTESAVGLITSDNRVVIIDADTLETFVGTISGNSLSGTLFSSITTPLSAQINSSSGNNISGTYSTSAGGGQFSLNADSALYNRPSSLSKLEGVWVDAFFTNISGTSTWVIQANGSFTVSTTGGCTASGTFSLINTSNNEYQLVINVTNCGTLNGSYSGLAVLSDSVFMDDTLTIVFNNSNFAVISEPIRQ